MKPDRQDDPAANVHLVRIPKSYLFIRFFNGGLERDGAWVLDFYSLRDRRPVNSPDGWVIYISPLAPNTKSLVFSGHVKSWEENWGYKKQEINPGEERFSLPEGVICQLVRPDEPNLYFETPTRVHQVPGIHVEKAVPLSQHLH